MTSYQELENQFRRISSLNHLRAITEWDEAVMMPGGGGEARAQALSDLAVIVTEYQRSPRLREVIQNAKKDLKLSDWQKANLREAEMEHMRATAVDPELVARQSQQNMLSQQAWRKLRAENNWQDFCPFLEKVVEIAREEARQRSAHSGLPLYESLVDIFQPGLTTAVIDRNFQILRKHLPDLTQQIMARQDGEKFVRLDRPVPIENQKKMMREFMNWLQFDFNHGRLDESHHPFCGGVPQDIRMTTRYSEINFLPGLLGVLHETGHALYEQGLPKEWGSQPVGSARGMSIHESQSLFVEMQIARSREFMQFAAPTLAKYLAAEQDPKEFWQGDNLYRVASRIRPGLIRVDADEVTYPMHVILRYELERALIEGSLSVRELPDVWNEKMQKYLGLSTKGDDKNGCMQDVHWPVGLFGYFPSYTFGALIAAQLFATIERSNSNVRSEITKGQISPLLDWLKSHIWSKAKYLSMTELLVQATGSDVSVEPFLSHVKKRYLD